MYIIELYIKYDTWSSYILNWSTGIDIARVAPGRRTALLRRPGGGLQDVVTCTGATPRCWPQCPWRRLTLPPQ